MKPFSYEEATQPAPDTGKPFSYEDATGKPPAGKGVIGHARDLGLAAARGAIAAPEIAVGAADLLSGGKAGKALENQGGVLGFRPKQAKEFLSGLETDQLKAQRREFSGADGVAEKFGVALSNPSLPITAIVESAAPMLAGGLAGRGVKALGMAKTGAGAAAIGEGAVMAGSAAEQIRQQSADGLLTGKQTALALGTGLVGAAVGAAGNKLGQAFGDVDSMIVDGAGRAVTAPARSMPARILGGGAVEAGEELAQSVPEQVFQNAALNRPLGEGVEDAAVMGALAGGVMGAGAGALNGRRAAVTPPPETQAPVVDPAGAPSIPSTGTQPILPPDTPTPEQAQAPAPGAPAGLPPEATPSAEPAPNQLDPALTTAETNIARTRAEWAAADEQRAKRLAVVGVAEAPPNSPLTAAAITAVDSGAHDLAQAAQQAQATGARTATTSGSAAEDASTQTSGLQARAPDGIDPRQAGLAAAASMDSQADSPSAGARLPHHEPAGQAQEFPASAGQSAQTPATDAQTQGAGETLPRRVDEFQRNDQPAAAPAPASGMGVQSSARQSVSPSSSPIETPIVAAPAPTTQERIAALSAEITSGLDATTGKPLNALQAGIRKAKMRQAIGQLPADQIEAARAKYDPPTQAMRQSVQGAVAEPAGDQDIAGSPITKEWTAFAPESGTLNVPRADMPQIKAEHRGAMVNFLKARGIESQQDDVPASTLKPTQAEFSPKKVARAASFEGSDRSILISSDGHVLDGHHQWLAKREAGAPVKVIRLNAPIARLLPIVKEFPSAQQAAGAQPPGVSNEKATEAQPQQTGPQAATAAVASPAGEVAPRPDTWRKNAIQASAIARSLGVDTKGMKPAEIVAAVERVDTARASGSTMLGQDNTPMAEGGQPFKTRGQAAQAKKLQPTMRVASISGGFALIDKTPAQLEAEKKAARRLGTPKTSPAGEPIPAHAFIASMGGLHLSARKDMNIGDNPLIGNRRLFAGLGKGLPIERATARLIEEGYLANGASHSDAMALIKRSLTSPQYTAEGYTRMAERDDEARRAAYMQQDEPQDAPEADPLDEYSMAYEDALDAQQVYDDNPELDQMQALGWQAGDFEGTGFNEADEALQREVMALSEMADAMGIDAEAIRLDAHEATQNATQQDYYETAISTLEAAIARSERNSRQNARQQSGATAAREEVAPEVVVGPAQEADGQRAPEAQPASEVAQAVAEVPPVPAAPPNPNSVVAKARAAKAKKKLTLRESAAQSRVAHESAARDAADRQAQEVQPAEPPTDDQSARRVWTQKEIGYVPAQPKGKPFQLVSQKEPYGIATPFGAKPKFGDFNQYFATPEDAAAWAEKNGYIYSENPYAKPKPAQPADTLTAPTPQQIITQQERAEAATQLDAKAQIDREAAAQTLTRPTAPEQRQDTSSDMFAMEKAQAEIDKRNAGQATRADANQGDIFAAPERTDQTPATQAAAILDAANVTGKERIDALKDVKKGDVTPEELEAAYPAKDAPAAPIEPVNQSAPPTTKTIAELKQAVTAAQAAWDADTVRIKRIAARDRVINEGGEGYSSAEAESEASARKHYPLVKAAKDDLFAAEWTPEVFAQRRATWNAEVAKTKNNAQLAALQKRLGYGVAELRDAKKMFENHEKAPTPAPAPAPKTEPVPAAATPAEVVPSKKKPYQTFKEWFDDADMPEKMPDGIWVDLETGIKYQGEPDKKIEKTWAERQAIKRANNLQRAMREIDAEKRKNVRALSLKDVSDKVKKMVRSQEMALEKIGISKESAALVGLANDMAEFGIEIQADIDEAGNASLLTKKSKDIKEKFLQLVELNVEASREQNRTIKAIQANRPPESATSKTPAPTLAPKTEAAAAPITQASPNNEAARAAYYTPGHVILSHTGTGNDEVLSYTPQTPERGWSVKVQSVRKINGKWEKVGRAVTHRQLPDYRSMAVGNVRDLDDGTAFSRSATKANAATQAAVDAITANWPNAPKIIVAHDMQDPVVPADVRAKDQQKRSEGAGQVEGFYSRGKVYLISSALKTPDDVLRVLAHEVLGHAGLRGMFGDSLNSILSQVATMRRAEIEAKANAYKLDPNDPAQRLQAAEEVLAEMAQTRPQIGFVKRAVSAIRNWLRANIPSFSNLKLTDDDIIAAYLLPARGFIERGAAGRNGGSAAFSRGTNESMKSSKLLLEKADTLRKEAYAMELQLRNLYGKDENGYKTHMWPKSSINEFKEKYLEANELTKAAEEIKKHEYDANPYRVKRKEEFFKQVKSAIDAGKYTSYGIRVNSKNPRTGKKVKVRIGGIARPSYYQPDGEATNLQHGTSAMGVDDDYSKDSIFELAKSYSHLGGEILLLGSDNTKSGNDPGEIEMKDARILAIYDDDISNEPTAPDDGNTPMFSRTPADIIGAGIDRARDAANAMAGRNDARAVDMPDLDAAQRRLLGKIGASPTPTADAIKAATDRAGVKIRQGLVDRYASLKELDERALGANFLDTAITDSSWVLAKMSSAAGGALNSMMTVGRIRYNAGQKVIEMQGEPDGGLTGALKKLGPPAEVERFFAWVAANRSHAIVERNKAAIAKTAEAKAELKNIIEMQAMPGKTALQVSQLADARKEWEKIIAREAPMLGVTERLFTLEEITAGMAMNTGNTEAGQPRAMLYAQAFNDFQRYRDDVLAIAESAGIISEENRAMWRDEFYVPFYRVMDEDAKTGGPAGGGGLSRQEAFKRLKGGKQNLNDLMENTLMNFHHLLSASLKNQAAAQAIKNAERAGLAHKVPESRRDTKTTFVLEGGKKAFYQVDDALVYESITSLSDPGLNSAAVQVMSAFKRMFTQLTTITPQFVIANTFRDLLQASATSPTSKNVGKNLVQGIKSYRDEKTRAEMLASGGAFSFGHIYGMDAEEVKASLRKTVAGAELISHPSMIPGILRKGWKAWDDIIDTSENISRAATYVQNVEQLGKLRAAFEARDVMDFSQHGAWPAVRFMIRVVPFLNARLQGLDKLYRSGIKPSILTAMGKGSDTDKQAATRFAMVAGALTVATMALYLANADDEEYQKLEEWQKDTYWFFRIGGNAYFLPKPFEVGAIATLAERGLQQAMDDKATGKLFAERIKEMLMQTFAFNPVPQLFQPVMDIYSNRDAFTGRDIETFGMERLSPGLRARDTTTAPARALSAATRVFGDESPVAVSPVQADHLIKGYLGGVGASAAGILDTMHRAATGQESPDKRFVEYQPIRRFYRDLETPVANTRYSTLFYDGLREANRVYADVQELQKLGRPEDANELSTKKRNVLQMRVELNAQQRRLSDISNRLKEVNRSDKDGAWKRREVDLLNTQRALITERAGKMIEGERAAR